ncbi:MAG: Chaperone protein DnaJ, partial [uncultured Solirubrobacteraceae bacterium]
GVPARPLQDPRGRQEGLPGGDQEGVPQARAPAPPGPQPGRQGGRGEVQGDLRGPRRPLGRRQAQAVRPGRALLRRRQPVRRGRRGGRRSRLVLGHPHGPVRQRHGRRAQPRRAHEAGAGEGLRPRDGGHPLLRPGDRGRAAPRVGRHPLRVPHLPGDGRPPGHPARRLPRLRGSRRGVPGPGAVLDLAPVPSLQRLGHRHRDAVPHLRGRGPHARAQALPGQHPGGREGRLADPPGRQGRGGAARRPGRGPLRGHARRPVARLHAEGGQPRGRGADHGRRGDPRRRRRGPHARRRQEAPRRAGHEARHGPAPARRGPAEARRIGPRRHPLPVRDRRAQGPLRGAAPGRRRALRRDGRKPARAHPARSEEGAGL